MTCYNGPEQAHSISTTYRRLSALISYVGQLGPCFVGNAAGHRVQEFSRSVLTMKSKGKAVPLQAWNGPEGSRKLRFPDFMTTAQDGGQVVSLTHRPPLPPGNTPGTYFC